MNRSAPSPIPLPDRGELEAHFADKHGSPTSAGWAPQRRFRSGYFTPSDRYEALLDRLVEPSTHWLDVGGGHQIFPDHPRLAQRLAERCQRLVAVDPSPNVLDHPVADERVQAMLEDYAPDESFDLASMRMVVEHVADPAAFTAALSRLLRPGGLAVVLTVDRFAPLSLLAKASPFGLHHPIKRLVWGGEERDTFPVQYRMNTLRELRRRFDEAGFDEVLACRLDDLSTFGGIKPLNRVELAAWRVCRKLGMGYPEACLLGVYRRRED